MTEKLYYSDPHRWEFDASVLSCTAEGDRYAVVLDRTCFFPEGGGQRADTGTLGGVSVIDAHESGDGVVHFCTAPLPVGSSVHGTVDRIQRFSRMQLHSGEHIVSGIAHTLWGCENVGFHMAADCVTIDFDRELDERQLLELERRANETVWRNLPVLCRFPDAAELETMEYRSKKALTGAIRIVEIPGIDRCACCAPHVTLTGEIGLIRLTDAARHRGGVRLTMRAGAAAWEYVRAEGKTAARLSALLSAPHGKLTEAVERLQDELAAAESALAVRERERLEAAARSISPTEGNICFFDTTDDMNALRAFANIAAEKCRICAAFAGTDGDWKYILASRTADLRAEGKRIQAAIEGRGGGSSRMLQGSARASRAEIERFFEV